MVALMLMLCFILSMGAASPGGTPEPLDDDGASWLSAATKQTMGRATGEVLSALPQSWRRATGNVHLCFHGEPDVGFIRVAVASGSKAGVAVSVWVTSTWRKLLGHITYQTRATHVLVGPRLWLLQWIDVIQEKAANNSINKQATQWVFVSTQDKDIAFQENLLRRLPEQLHFLLLQPLARPSLHFTPSTSGADSQKQRQGGRGGERRGTEEDVEVRRGKEECYEKWKADVKIEEGLVGPRGKEPVIRMFQFEGTAEGGLGAIPRAERPINKPFRKDTRTSCNQEDMELMRQSRVTFQRDGATESLELSSRGRRQLKTVFLKDTKTSGKGETLRPAPQTKRLIETTTQRDWNPGRGLKVISRVKRQIRVVISRDREATVKDHSLGSTATAQKLSKVLLQRGTLPNLSSPEGHIDLLMAVYAGNGSASFRKTGYWRNSSQWVFEGPLHAAFASQFGGRTLTLAAIHKPSVFEPSDDGGMGGAGGYMAQVLRDMERHLNFTSRVTTTNSFGILLSNGTWNGMVGYLTRREADLAPLDFSPTWERIPYVDFSEWFGTDGVIIISQAPKSLKPPFLLLQVFSVGVWASMVVVGVVSGHVLWGLDFIIYHCADTKKSRSHTPPPSNQYYHNHRHHYSNDHSRHDHRHSPRRSSYWETLAVVLKLFVVQSSNERKWSRLWSGRILSSCLLLAALSVVALYQGSIIAFLAVPRGTQPIDSVTQLMERQHLDSVVPVLRKDTMYYNFILNCESYRPIRASLVYHQDSFLNTWSFFQDVEQGKYALIDTYSSAVGRAANFENRGRGCRFHVSRDSMKTDLDIMLYPQNSVYGHRFNQVLCQLRSFGLIDKIRSGYFTSSCKRETGQHDPLSLSLKQMQSAFYVLALGVVLSVFCFTGELVSVCRG